MSPRGAVLVAPFLVAGALVLLAPAAALPAAVFLGASLAALAFYGRSADPLSMERIVRSFLFLAVVGGLLLPAAAGLVRLAGTVLEELAGVNAVHARLDFLVTVLVCLGLLALARRWPFGEGAFLVLGSAGALAVKLAWVLRFRMEPISDFQSLWFLTSEVVEKGLGDEVLPHATLLWRLYRERILPYLLPLRLTFGPEPSSYTIPNVLLGLLCSLLTYRLVRGWFGPRAARVAFVVSLAAVETVLAAAIPSHDIPGAFYTLLALAVFVEMVRLQAAGRLSAALAASAGFGFLTVIVELQRTTGAFVLLACALAGLPALLSRKTVVAALGLALLLPLAVFLAGNGLLRAAGLKTPPEMLEERRNMVLASATDSWGDGSFGHAYDYAARYADLEVGWADLALRKLVSDTWHSPGARLSLYLRKSMALFDLGSQTLFYVRGGELAGVGVIEEKREARVVFVARCFALLFLAGLVVGGWRLCTASDVPWLSLLPPLYLAVLAAGLIFLAEVQPRYLYQIWYLGAVPVGFLFRDD